MTLAIGKWGSGGVTATIVAIVIMVGMIAYGATTATKAPPNSAALHHRTTGQAHTPVLSKVA
jgi:hypothetical protein